MGKKENLGFKNEDVNSRGQNIGKLFWEKSGEPYFTGGAWTDIASAKRIAAREKVELIEY